MRSLAAYSMSLLAVLAALCPGNAVAVPTAGQMVTNNVHAFTNHMNSTQAEFAKSRHSHNAANGASGASLTMVNNEGDSAKAYITCKHPSLGWAYAVPNGGGWRSPVPGVAKSDAVTGFDLGAVGKETYVPLETYVDDCRVYGSKDDLQLGE